MTNHCKQLSTRPQGQVLNNPAADRRQDTRVIGFRSLELIIGGGSYPFCLRNISPHGAMGNTGIGVLHGEQVRLKFEDGTIVPATVRWANGARVGLEFISPISMNQLKPVVFGRTQREPRHRTSRRAVIVAGSTYRLVTVTNLSSGGLQIESALPFPPGRKVTVTFERGPSLECQVRWTHEGKSGLMFAQRVILEEFG